MLVYQRVYNMTDILMISWWLFWTERWVAWVTRIHLVKHVPKRSNKPLHPSICRGFRNNITPIRKCSWDLVLKGNHSIKPLLLKPLPVKYLFGHWNLFWKTFARTWQRSDSTRNSCLVIFAQTPTRLCMSISTVLAVYALPQAEGDSESGPSAVSPSRPWRGELHSACDRHDFCRLAISVAPPLQSRKLKNWAATLHWNGDGFEKENRSEMSFALKTDRHNSAEDLQTRGNLRGFYVNAGAWLGCSSWAAAFFL